MMKNLAVVDKAFKQLNSRSGHLHQPELEDAIVALEVVIPTLSGSERYGMALRDMCRDLATLTNIASSRAANPFPTRCRGCQR